MVDDKGEMKTYNSTDGNFSFNIGREHTYVVTGDKQGFSSTRATVNTMDVERTDPDDTAYVTVYLDEIVNNFRVSNIYYDYDKSELRPESVASLDSLVNFMRDNGSLSIEIYSYTDGKGTDKYNDALSLRRAEAVKSYLVQSGIEESRMLAKPLGAKNPTAENTTASGADNPLGRQLNRRTEFRIVTDVPTRRVIFNSAQPGSIDQQSKNLEMGEDANEDTESDAESEMGNPGSRVNNE
jgi:outer membrane protein OmpA-like peptidoglycan-associated protein